MNLAEKNNFSFAEVDKLGSYNFDNSFNNLHIEKVLNLDLVNVELVKKSNFKVVLDAVNSTGGFMIPKLLEKMGVDVSYIVIQMESFLIIQNHYQRI